jgi:hypothetical protein
MKDLPSGVGRFSRIAKRLTRAEQVLAVTSRFFRGRLTEMRWETAPYLCDGRELTEHTEEILRGGPDFRL